MNFLLAVIYGSPEEATEAIGLTMKQQKQKKQKILFLELFWNISKSRKNLFFLNFEMHFLATYSYCPGESINHLGMGLFHWKALQIDFEKCHFGKRLLLHIYHTPAAPPKSFLSFFFLRKFGAVTAIAVAILLLLILFYHAFTYFFDLKK